MFKFLDDAKAKRNKMKKDSEKLAMSPEDLHMYEKARNLVSKFVFNKFYKQIDEVEHLIC